MDGVNEEATRVVIKVRDVNDLPPNFNRTFYEATIFEESLHMVRPIITVSCNVMLEPITVLHNFIFLF